jgi:hypothetical protein
MTSRAELREKIKQLREMSIDWALNKVTGDDKAPFRAEYEALREEIIENAGEDVHSLLPEAVREHISIQEFWTYILKHCPDAKKRRAFLHEEYKPVLLLLEKPAAHLDLPPDFAPLASDQEMKEILIRHWIECQVCIRAGAYFAATVMMGSLLEGLFLARSRSLADKGVLSKAEAAPKIDGKVMPFDKWKLSSFINVACELKWITESAKGVSEKLRDYRNFIHPFQYHKNKIKVGRPDAVLLWDWTKSIAAQLLDSVAKAH